MAYLSVRGLTKRFGAVVAADAVTFEVEKGEWVAILGPSGSGKSTVLHCIAQLQRLDAGSILLEGAELARLSEDERAVVRRERLGIVFQQFHLLPYLTALENVMLAQWLHSMADREEAVAALERVGLAHRLDHLPRQLSGGEQQRTCIARALINGPSLLLADEPTGSLDEASQEGVLDVFSKLHQDGLTLLTVTHDAAVGRRADREIVLEHGRISGTFGVPRDAESEIDRVLERALDLEAASGPASRESLALRGGRRLVDAAIARGLLGADERMVRLTAEGRVRGESFARRRRLAERLMAQALHDHDDARRGECPSGHALAPDAVDATCGFLGHPRTCPHGRAIPPGPCCG